MNYHRAINRAEKEPLGNGRPWWLTLLSSARGCGGGDVTTLPQLLVSVAAMAQTLLFFAHFGTSTFLLLYVYFEQLCVVPI